MHGAIIGLTGYKIGSKLAKNEDVKPELKLIEKYTKNEQSEKAETTFILMVSLVIIAAVLKSIVGKFLNIGTKISRIMRVTYKL